MNILIVDDEQRARIHLKQVLSELLPDATLYYAKDGIEALYQIEENSFDLIFLDIEMPNLSGIEVAQTMAERELKIIFTTAYHQHALKAFELCALDYILKPFSKKRVSQALAKVAKMNAYKVTEKTSQEVKKISFKLGNSYKVFSLCDVSAISTADDYLEVYHKDTKFLVSMSLDSVQERLPKDKFLRVHRSHMINTDYVEELKVHGGKKYSVCLNDYYQLELPVSRYSVSDLKEILGL